MSDARKDEWVKTYCHGCLSATCGMIVHVVDGVVVGIQGDVDNPYNRGKLCAKAYAQIMTLYDPLRPTNPLVRTNPEKGIGVDPRWKEISWHEAFDIASQKLKSIHASDPGQLAMSTGDMSGLSLIIGPVVASFGTPNLNITPGYYCGSSVHIIPYGTIGCFHMQPDFEFCNHLVLWGSNKGGMLQHLGVTVAAEIAEARARRGMKLICIDPIRSNIGAKADEWIPIRPGTDMAMALAWLHVLLHETELYDSEYIKRYSNGPYLVNGDGHYVRDGATGKPLMWNPICEEAKAYDADFSDVAIEGSYDVNGVKAKPAFALLKEHVRLRTPEWAAPITTVPAETIRRLAREFGEAARIGSTITYGGYQLPYRPAAIHWYTGISQHVNGLATGVVLQLIHTVIGNLLVPGGVVGDGTVVEYPYGPRTLWTGKDGEPGEVDGLFFPSNWARFGGTVNCGYPARKVEQPTTAGGGALFPVGIGEGMATFEINNLHPERFNYKIPRPKVYLGRHASDVTCKGNPSEVARVLSNFYQISCEPLIDETAEFADLFFPVPTALERLQVGSELPGYAGGTANFESYCINFSQPVVPPKGREMLDIWGEIMERMALRTDYNQLINVIWDLQGEYRLELDRKYTYAEMTERFGKSLFGEKLAMEARQAGHIKWHKSVKERYPRPFIKPRTPIYYEHWINAGGELAGVTQALGFEWDVSGYKPLPDWQPGPAHRESKPGFDLFAIPFRLPFLSHMWSTHNPWLLELAELHPWGLGIVMNASTAKRMGIQDGDRIVVEATTGYQEEGSVKLSECVHPEVVALSRHGGHWASRSVARGKGTLFNTLVPHTTEYQDHHWGNLEACIRVRVRRATGQ